MNTWGNKARVRVAVLALIAVAVSSCLGANASSRSQLMYAAGQYEVAQIAIEGAVTSPTIDPKAKAALQRVDLEATAAIASGEAAIKAGNGDKVAFYTGLITAAITRARLLVATAEQPVPPPQQIWLPGTTTYTDTPTPYGND
jgi:hypothetical protein